MNLAGCPSIKENVYLQAGRETSQVPSADKEERKIERCSVKPGKEAKAGEDLLLALRHLGSIFLNGCHILLLGLSQAGRGYKY